MQLSLMLINLLTEIFMDENFVPRENPDIHAYEKVLGLAHDAGYKAVDITDMESVAFGAEKVKKLLDRYGLACGSVILFENYTCLDKKEQMRVREHTMRAIDNTEKIGCSTMMIVAAGAQQGLDKDELRQGLVENLSAAVAYAADKNITICIEDFPSREVPMCAGDDIEYLLGHAEGLMLTYDTANMLVEGEEPLAYYQRFKDRIGYCHLKDVRITDGTEKEMFGDTLCDGRKMITTYHGKGIIDFKSIIKCLEEDRYQGYLSVEYAKDGEEENLLQILTDEREYLEQLMER